MHAFEATTENFAHERHGVKRQNNGTSHKRIEWISHYANKGRKKNQLNDQRHTSEYIQHTTKQYVDHLAAFSAQKTDGQTQQGLSVGFFPAESSNVVDLVLCGVPDLLRSVPLIIVLILISLSIVRMAYILYPLVPVSFILSFITTTSMIAAFCCRC